MESFTMFLFLISILGFITSLIILIVFAVRKKKIKVPAILLGVFAVTFILSIALKPAQSNNYASSQDNTAVTTDNNTSSNTTQSSSENKTVTYKYGEDGKSGNWNIKILDVKEETTIVAGDSSENKTTQQKFIVIKLQMKNDANQATSYSLNEFKLADASNKNEYDPDLEAGEAANQKETIYNENKEYIGVFDDVNPGLSKQTYIVFEVPKDFDITNGVLINANADSDAVGYYLK